MIKKYFFLLFILSFYSNLNAQLQLSLYSEVSIVTAGPGEELYEAFGHSAVRVKDPVLNLDLIYNYGVFDFNQPNFLLNFSKGNMIYSLARYDFKYFLASYKRDKRWLKQQVLNLNQEEKQAYFTYLEKNALPENRNYLYDPYFDNCATILRDITKTVLGDKVTFNDNHIEKDLTFRQLTNKEIHWNTWGSFGLNLIAGIKLDKKATSDEYMFLPDYVMSAFKNANLFIKNQPQNFVKREDILLKFEEKKPTISIFNPLLIFSIIALLGIFITYKDYKKNKRTKTLDVLLFFFSGMIGLVLFFLWFFSTHSTAPNNFNILWAFPINLIVGIILTRNKSSKKLLNYVLLLIILMLIIPILWITGVQVYPIPLIPLLLLFIIRYLYLYRTLLSSVK